VLELAAEKAGWGTPLPAGRARGIAVMDAFGSYLAQVTEVSVDARGNVRVHKIVCSVDTGWVINPDTIKAQMEGGIVYGLTAALKGEITIKNGRVEQRHFGDYQMLRHNEMPAIEVYIVPSTEAPGGIGEPSTALAAGSLVNAVSAATGKRIYALPIRAQLAAERRSWSVATTEWLMVGEPRTLSPRIVAPSSALHSGTVHDRPLVRNSSRMAARRLVRRSVIT
jgi:isoquinoline 1-oxidoreductase beta subunit